MKKKILFLIPSQNMGGAEIKTFEIAKEFSKSNYRGIVSFYKSKNLQFLINQYLSIGFKYQHAVLVDQTNCHWRHLIRKFSVFRTFFTTCFLLLKYQPDIVFITKPWTDSATGSTLACACFNVKTIIRYALVDKSEKCKVHIKKILCWAKCRNQTWVALSRNNQQLLSELYDIPQSQIALIYNGYKGHLNTLNHNLTSIRDELDLPANSVLLLTVASIDFRKGYDFLLDTITTVVKQNPNTYYIWVGKGPLEDYYKKKIRKMGLQNKVFLLGQRNDVPRLMKESNLFIFPSRAEGFPGSILEAIFYKLPIIAFNTSSLPEIIKHNYSGLLAKEESSDDLMIKILYALESPDILEYFAEKAQRALQTFSYSKMMQSYLFLADHSKQRY